MTNWEMKIKLSTKWRPRGRAFEWTLIDLYRTLHCRSRKCSLKSDCHVCPQKPLHWHVERRCWQVHRTPDGKIRSNVHRPSYFNIKQVSVHTLHDSLDTSTDGSLADAVHVSNGVVLLPSQWSATANCCFTDRTPPLLRWLKCWAKSLSAAIQNLSLNSKADSNSKFTRGLYTFLRRARAPTLQPSSLGDVNTIWLAGAKWNLIKFTTTSFNIS